MSQGIEITEAITTLGEAEQRFSLQRNEDQNFFTEWQRDLPILSTTDLSTLDNLRQRYVYHRTEGHLLESTVTLLLVSPLLALAGFYDPPYRVRAEEWVRLILPDSEEILQGRIDALVVCDALWIVILESKKTMLSIWSALPQALAYLMANPNLQHPCFAMLTNGDEILFVKVAQTDSLQYSLSRVFALLVSQEEIASALQVLRRIAIELIKRS